MAGTNYPTTLTKLLNWTMDIHDQVNAMNHKYAKLKYAVDTGEGDPNNVVLTPDQIAILQADMATIEHEVEQLCSAHDVDPVEIPD